MHLSDIAILNIFDYRCIISGISKIEAINLMRNAGLSKKTRNIIKQNVFITYKNGYRNANIWCY